MATPVTVTPVRRGTQLDHGKWQAEELGFQSRPPHTSWLNRERELGRELERAQERQRGSSAAQFLPPHAAALPSVAHGLYQV
ncbi:unnamed protein product [Boreogadus saida]